MRKSFQDQLLTLGLVDKKKAGKIKKEQHQKKRKKSKKPVVDENAELARLALEKKKKRARELNRQREEKLAQRAKAARVKQLVNEHRISLDDNGLAYRFTEGGKIRRIYVAEKTVADLSRGHLGIIRMEENYMVVPAKIIEKIVKISDSYFTLVNNPPAGKEADPDDPYGDYQIPDDLMW